MRIESEYCQVELVLDDPERTYRDVDVVSGTVRFEAGDQQLLVYCQPKIGFGVELYGADNARRVAEHRDGIEIKLQPVASEASADDVVGLGSVNNVGAVMRVEHDDGDDEEPEPLVVEAGETGEIRFSQRVGDDVPSFRGEILSCRPAMIARFWINVGADEAGNPVDSTEGTCWAPIRLEVVSSGDSEEQMGERAAELQEQLQGHIKATQEWPLGRLLKWACILLLPMLALIPIVDPDHNPGKNAIDMASMLVFVLGLVCPSWIGAGMLLLLVRRWFRNMKSDQGRSLDPAEGYHVVYLLDGRDRLSGSRDEDQRARMERPSGLLPVGCPALHERVKEGRTRGHIRVRNHQHAALRVRFSKPRDHVSADSLEEQPSEDAGPTAQFAEEGHRRDERNR
ncbi:MAG: hypothetical protein ABGZ17_00035, partial [Planctomycetaceae bacterium]